MLTILGIPLTMFARKVALLPLTFGLLVAVLTQHVGAASYRLDDIPPGLSVRPFFQVSPDSSQVIYDSPRGLKVVPIVGGSSLRLNSYESAVGAFLVSPDSNYVAYTDDEDTSGTAELYSVPITGGTPVKLNGATFPGTDIHIQEVRFTPDSSHVVFKAREVSDTIELFSSPVSGGGSTKINVPLTPGYTVSNDIPNEPFVISPDSTTVIYTEVPHYSSGTLRR